MFNSVKASDTTVGLLYCLKLLHQCDLETSTGSLKYHSIDELLLPSSLEIRSLARVAAPLPPYHHLKILTK